MRSVARRILLPDPEALAFRLGAGRAMMGVAMLAAPVRSVRALGADTATAGRVTWLSRMVAIRDGVLGAGGAFAARGGGSTAPWLLAGAASDAVDAVVLAAALRSGRIKGVLPTVVVPAAAASAVLGAVAALRESRH